MPPDAQLVEITRALLETYKFMAKEEDDHLLLNAIQDVRRETDRLDAALTS